MFSDQSERDPCVSQKYVPMSERVSGQGTPTLTHCNSPEGDSAAKGFAIVPYIQGIAEPIRRVLRPRPHVPV